MIFTRLGDASTSLPHRQCEAEIREPVNSWFLPRSQRDRNVRRAKVLGFAPERCQHRSSILVGKKVGDQVEFKFYCTKHAASLALSYALGEV